MKAFGKRLIKFFSVLILVVIPTALFFTQTDYGLFKIQDVRTRVTGPETLLPIRDDVQSKAAKLAEGLRGRYLWQMDVKELKKKIQSDARVANASVVRNWLGSVALNIELHKPELLLARGRARWSVVTRDGSVLPETNRIFDLPVLRGEAFQKNSDLRRRAQDIIGALPQSGTITSQSVSEILYDPIEGFTLNLSESETQVRLGFDHFAFRLKLVDRVMAHLQKHELQSRVIDARFKQKVVVRLRNAP